jgi:hypothetical protein
MGDDLVWIDLTSLAEEKYPEPREKWIKIKEDSLNFILYSLECDLKDNELAEDPCYKLELFNIIEELKSQEK